MGERELAGQRDVDGYPDGSSPQEVLQSPMSLEWTNGSCESGGFDISPFQRGDADLSIMEVKAVSEVDKENQKVIDLAKSGENISISGLERKAMMLPEAHTSELPSNAILKAKEECSCALCQVSTRSKRDLKEHLQARKRNSMVAALTSQKAGGTYKIGFNAKKVELNVQSLLVLEKSGEESPTISGNLKENQSGLVQEEQKNGYAPNPEDVGKKGSESVQDTGKNTENISGPGSNTVTQPGSDTSELPSNVVLKAKEEWSCALCQVSAGSARGLNTHLQGKKHKSKEAALASQNAGENYKIGFNANKVELNAQSLLVVEKSGLENPTISENLKENQSGLVHEEQKNADTPISDNIGKKGSESVRETGENGKNIPLPRRNALAQRGSNTDELPSNVVLKVKEEWSCALCKVSAGSARGLNFHLQGKKHRRKKTELTSQMAQIKYEIGQNENKVELKPKTCLIEKIGEENPTVSDNLTESQSGSVQEVQKTSDPQNPDNLGENGSELSQGTWKNGDPMNKKYNWCELYKIPILSQKGKAVSVEDKKQSLIDQTKLVANISGLKRKAVTQPEADTREVPSSVFFKAKEWSCASSARGLNTQLQGKKRKSKEAALTSQNAGENYKIGFNANKVELNAQSLLVIEKSGLENPTISENLKENQSGLVHEEQKNADTPISDNIGKKGSESVRETGENGKNIPLPRRNALTQRGSNTDELPSNVVLKVKEEWSCALCKVSAGSARGLNFHLQGKKHRRKKTALTSQMAQIKYEIGQNENKVELKPKTCLIEKIGEENPAVSDNLTESQSGSVQEVQKTSDPQNPDNLGENGSELSQGTWKNGDPMNKKYNWCELYKIPILSQKGKAVSVEDKKQNVIDQTKLVANISGLKRKAVTQPEADTRKVPSSVVFKAKEWSCAGSARGLNTHLQGKKRKSKEAALTSQNAGENYKIGFNANKVELNAQSLLVIEKSGLENPTISENLKENQSGLVHEEQKNADTPISDNIGKKGSESVRETGENGKNIPLPRRNALTQRGSNTDELPSNVVLKVKEEWSCALCKVSAGSARGLNFHLQGKKHRRKKTALTSQMAQIKYEIGQNENKVELKPKTCLIEKIGEENPTVSDNLTESQSGSVQEVQKTSDPQNPDNLGENGSELSQGTWKNGDPMNKKYNWCGLYKIPILSQKGKAVSVEDKKQSLIDQTKLVANISGLKRKAVTQPEADTREVPSSVVFKAKEWSCAGSARGLNTHLQGKKRNSKEAALTSQNAGENYKIGFNANKVELNAQSLLVIEKSGLENPTISENLKENQSGLVHEEQKNADTPISDNIGKKGSESVRETGENGKNIPLPRRNALTQRGSNTDELPSNVVLKVKEEWSCALCKVSAGSARGLNFHLQGKKHRCKKTALTSQMAQIKYEIGQNENKVELKPKTCLIEKIGEENPTVSDNLTENQSCSVQEVQKTSDPQNPDNLGENGSELSQGTWKNGDPMNKKYNWCELYKIPILSQKGKAVSVEDKKQNVIDQTKLLANISGPKGKAVTQPEADTCEVPSNVVFKAKKWSSALCQVRAGSPRGLNNHLQRKKHKSKEAAAALTSLKAGDYYKIGFNANKVGLNAQYLGVTLEAMPPPKIKLVQWERPPPGWVKVNTDGSSRGKTGVSGVGGVIRDSSADVLAAFSVGIGVATNNAAELRAAVHGMKMATDMGCCNIWLEVDAETIINLLRCGRVGDMQLHRLIMDFQRMIRGKNIKLSHVYREGNTVADFLAKKGATLQHQWAFPPMPFLPELRGYIKLDKWGFPGIRMR